MSTLSVVIPTYNRGETLLETLAQFPRQRHRPNEIIVVDQSADHPPPVMTRLQRLADGGSVQLIRRTTPSIPAAMNAGAAAAGSDIVLFLDDDVRMDADLVGAHLARHRHEDVAIVAGRVLQPWHGPAAAEDDENGNTVVAPDAFAFHCATASEVRRFSGGNVSMRRHWLRRVGGFDENFFGAAYRFEADFAQRVLDAGGRIVFEPAALIHHLHVASGGTRSFGHHLRTVGPWHSAGRWYYLLRHPRTPGLLGLTLREVRHAVLARSHLRAPWRIPVSMAAEVSGIACATAARLRGPRLGLDADPRP